MDLNHNDIYFTSLAYNVLLLLIFYHSLSIILHITFYLLSSVLLTHPLNKTPTISYSSHLRPILPPSKYRLRLSSYYQWGSLFWISIASRQPALYLSVERKKKWRLSENNGICKNLLHAGFTLTVMALIIRGSLAIKPTKLFPVD